MKKVLVIVFVLIASYGYAQDLKFGVKAGLNLANVAGDDVDNNKVNTRFYFGGFLNTPLSDAVSFQPELLVSMQGFEVDMDDSDVDLALNTTYLNIPLLFKMRLGASNSVHFYAGPQLGFLLKAEEEAESGSESYTNDIKDEMNSVDFSLNIGFSFNVNEDFALDLRYNRGLTKLIEDGGKAYNSVIQLGASYSF